jgi:hypothetical protein
MSILPSGLKKVEEVTDVFVQDAHSEVKSIKDFYVWSSVVRGKLMHLQESVQALRQHYAQTLSVIITPLHTLPVEVLLYILQLVVWDVSLFHQMRIAFHLRLVCSRWNRMILKNPGFLQSVFINVSTVPFPVHHLSSFPLDVTWWIHSGTSTVKNIPAFESIFSSASPVRVRSFHMVFRGKQLSSRVVHAINQAIVQHPFLSLTHLELVNFPPDYPLPDTIHFPSVIPFPELDRFPNLITLVLRNTLLPMSYNRAPIPLQHLHLERVIVQYSNHSPPLDPPCPTLLNACLQLRSLRLENVTLGPTLDSRVSPTDFRPMSPFLERIDCSIDSVDSLFFASLVMEASSHTLTELNVLLKSSLHEVFCPSDAVERLAHVVSPSILIFIFQSKLCSCFIDPKAHQAGATALLCGQGLQSRQGQSRLA